METPGPYLKQSDRILLNKVEERVEREKTGVLTEAGGREDGYSCFFAFSA